MARAGGIALKSVQWFLRFVEFCCAAVALSIFSYFLATLTNHQLSADNYIRAVEGISGIALCYTVIDVLLVCCLGGLGFFAFVAFILDIALAGGFAFIAWYNRQGASTCNGYVETPFGSGDGSSDGQLATPQGNTVLPNLHQACQLETAVFSVSIIAIFFFLISAVVEIAMWRHHQAEKKNGTSPTTLYPSGSEKRRFWQRKRRNQATMSGGRAIHPDALPPHSTPADARTSYQTDNTFVAHEAPYQKQVV